MALFSQGDMSDKPFRDIKAAFPAISMQVQAQDTQASADKGYLDTFHGCSTADVLILSCGSFTYLLGTINKHGVKLATSCIGPGIFTRDPDENYWSGGGAVKYHAETGQFNASTFMSFYRQVKFLD